MHEELLKRTACYRLLLLDGQHPTVHGANRFSELNSTRSSQNPYWGNPDDTVRKVEEFWKTDYIDIAPQVEGAHDALVKLTQNGFRLVVVTARQMRELDRSLVWVEKNLPGLIDTFICTGQSQETLLDGKELVTKLSKADVRSFALCFPLRVFSFPFLHTQRYVRPRC